jgi:hypothetical protein
MIIEWQPFLLCGFCQSTSTGDLSTFCSLPHSLSSGVSSSSCRGHFHPLLSLFLGIWFFFEVIVNGIVSLYIFPQFVHYWCIEMLLIFVSWFCILLLYWSYVWCLEDFQWSFFESLWYRIMSCANRHILTVSLLICIPFISSSCLIAMAWNSRTMLNRSGDSVRLCLIPDFRGNGFSFSSLSMMLA